MTKKKDSLATQIINAFGGITACSKALGHRNPTTVQGWKESGRIPPWRNHEIIAAAERDGIELPDDFYSEAAA